MDTDEIKLGTCRGGQVPPSGMIKPKGWKLAVLFLMTVVVGWLIWGHVNGINGPDYWRWPWRISRGWGPYLVLLAAAAPDLVMWMSVFSPGCWSTPVGGCQTTS